MITEEDRNRFKSVFSTNLKKDKEILKILKKYKLKENNIDKLSESIDENVYKWSKNYLTKKMITNPEEHDSIRDIYSKKFFLLYTNLLPSQYIKNNYLINEILSENIQISELCNLEPQKIFPDNWKEILEEKKEIDKIKYSIKEEVTTDEYRCRRCKNNKCTYYQRQTRSGDESMTTFITCTVCNNRWRI